MTKRCDSCKACYINDVYCHETGCPAAWKDSEPECRWCGSRFTPTFSGQAYCEDSCYVSYVGA